VNCRGKRRDIARPDRAPDDSAMKVLPFKLDAGLAAHEFTKKRSMFEESAVVPTKRKGRAIPSQNGAAPACPVFLSLR
jgi:hypothetical protein